MNKDQELRGDIRELLSNTLTIINALERLECNKELLNNYKGQASSYRTVLELLDKAVK
jgi:hypothetical protein